MLVIFLDGDPHEMHLLLTLQMTVKVNGYT